MSAMPVFTPQLQTITVLWPVLISHPQRAGGWVGLGSWNAQLTLKSLLGYAMTMSSSVDSDHTQYGTISWRWAPITVYLSVVHEWSEHQCHLEPVSICHATQRQLVGWMPSHDTLAPCNAADITNTPQTDSSEHSHSLLVGWWNDAQSGVLYTQFTAHDATLNPRQTSLRQPFVSS